MSYATAVSSELSIPSYLAAGYVSDLILNRETTDIDIMVEGDGILFAKKLAEKLNVDNVVIYEKFQTALIPLKEIQIEILSLSLTTTSTLTLLQGLIDHHLFLGLSTALSVQSRGGSGDKHQKLELLEEKEPRDNYQQDHKS